MVTLTQVPDWRKNAAPGMTLASVMPKPLVDAGPSAQLPQTSGAPQQINTWIRPAARDRWMANYLNYYTPDKVENIARGAMSGNLVSQWLMFDLMEQTWPRLSKNLNELKDAVIDLAWELQPFAPKGQKPSKEAQRRAKVIDQILWGMKPDVTVNENDFQDTIRDVLDAVGKGISVLESDWQLSEIQVDFQGKPPKIKPEDYEPVMTSVQVFAPRATRWVHPRYYGYPPYGVAQDRLMLNSAEIMMSNPDVKFNELWVPFDQNEFIISVIKQKTGHPLNSSMLRILGIFWAAFNFDFEWFINLAQIFGQPIRWVEYDPTQKNLLTLVSQMLQSMGSSAWGAFPAGTKLNLQQGITSARDNPQKVLIDMMDQVADILILGQTLTTSQGERGSQSLGKVHKNVRDEKVMAVAGRGAKILNQQFLPAICRKNFGNDNECPWLQPTPKDSKSSIENAQRDQILLAMGMELPRQWTYERHGVPVPQDGEDVITGSPAADQEERPPGEPPVNENDNATARARGINTLETLTNNVLENLTGVQSRWLGAVRPEFVELVKAAKSGAVSDAQFITALERASKKLPELFTKLDTRDLALAMEKAMGAAAVNGAVAGMMARRAS